MLTFKELVIIAPMEDAVKERMLEDSTLWTNEKIQHYAARLWEMVELQTQVRVSQLQQQGKKPGEIVMLIIGEYVGKIALADPDDDSKEISSTLQERLFPNVSVDPAEEMRKLLRRMDELDKK